MKTGFLPHLAAVASLHAAACAPPATVARGEDASATPEAAAAWRFELGAPTSTRAARA